jgi:hypothetical protein
MIELNNFPALRVFDFEGSLFISTLYPHNYSDILL